MKRKGNQTEQIASLDNLYLAYTKAKRGKACKKEVLEFTKNFDATKLKPQLHHQLFLIVILLVVIL